MRLETIRVYEARIGTWRPLPWNKGFAGVCGWGSAQAASGLTAGMPLSSGMCWSLQAAYGSPPSPETRLA